MNKRELTRLIINNKRLLFILIISFVVGIVTGSLCVKTLTDMQKGDMIEYLSNFFKVLQDNQDINKTEMFVQLLKDYLKVFIILYILGFFSVGVFIIPIIVLFKGFILGFTIGFIIDELFIKGLLFSLLTIFPQNVFYIIGLILSCLIGIMLSFEKLKSKKRFLNRKSKKVFFEQALFYLIFLSFGYIFMVIGSIFEAYITPVFMIFFSNKLF